MDRKRKKEKQIGIGTIGGAGSQSDYEAWNYHDPTQPQYYPSITGVIVAIDEIQSRSFATKQPEFWPPNSQGQVLPKLSVRFTIQGKSGKQLPWVITPKSVGWEALISAFGLQAGQHLQEIGGRVVCITTTEDRNQWIKSTGGGFARPWRCEAVNETPWAQFKGYTEFAMPQTQGQQVQAVVLQQPQATPVPPATDPF